jgi:hypothetical protein
VAVSAWNDLGHGHFAGQDSLARHPMEGVSDPPDDGLPRSARQIPDVYGPGVRVRPRSGPVQRRGTGWGGGMYTTMNPVTSMGAAGFEPATSCL